MAMNDSKLLELKRPLTITVANSKGGVGKSTIIRYLSYSLALMGYKTLVIDEDPQANTTKTMILTRERYHTEDDIFVLDKTLMAGVRDGNLEDLIVNVMDNLDVIPSHIDFKRFPAFLNKIYGSAEEGDLDYVEIESKKVNIMKDLIAPFKHNYDFILIDTPPTISDYTRTATVASDYIIIAFQTQSDSLDGAVDYIEDQLTELVEVFGAETDVLGILPNQLSNTGAIDKQVLDDAIGIFGEQNIFNNIIPFAKRVQSAPRTGMRNDLYWDKKLFKDIIDPLTIDFLERVAIMEGIAGE
ncbi:ParA family protein [Listeria booriae]|nr:ParA family protein [Listeria booriae]MDT0112163.1 ParA family protein [Listeria booriae]